MTETEVATQKPLAGYALPRRDESIVAAVPHSLIPGRAHSQAANLGRSPASAPAHAPVSAPAHAPVSSPAQAAMAAALREDDRTMVTRSRFGDDMSVHDERTVIGQIPKEALEFERMFAQRTQPPPPDAPAKSAPAVAPVPSAPLPSFADENRQEDSKDSEDSEDSGDSDQPKQPEDAEDAEDRTKNVPVQVFSQSEPPTLGTLSSKSSSDVRALVSLAEATHPSVARSVTARRLRVTLVAVLVLAVLVLLFVVRMPR